MKAEELSQKCPECGCADKVISTRKNPEIGVAKLMIPHLPDGDVGVIKCSECGHLFEYCKDHPMPLEVKKRRI